jgi:hypothetical protein
LGEFLGTLLASGIVSAGALFALFKIFGEKWLDAKFEQRLAKYKHEHDQEIERLRGRINALMDRTIKLHQHEFETLPQVWSRLNDAFGLTQSLVASFQSYPDLSGISADHLDEFLNTTPLHNWEKVTRLADGDLSRLPALAENLVNTRVDAILAAAPPAVQAASGATKSIPVIALDLESDPVASGFIASLARPGGNVTGVFLDFPEFSAKCLQMLIETLSGCFSSGLTRSGLYRGPRCGDRIPLGGGSTQSIARARGRFGAPSREHDCRGRRLCCVGG